MIPASFDYQRAGSADEAIALLTEHGDEAKLLAGGHSLLPLMKLRLASPSVLIDVGRLDDLRYIRDAGDHIAIGALTRHRELETSALLAEAAPLLSHAAGHVGDPQVRHRGTIGGSLANSDPAADYPGAVMGLNGTIVTNKRSIKADDYFLGLFETALERDEIITSVRFPIPERAAYQKFRHPASGYAVVGVMVSKTGADVRVGVTGAGPCAFRMSEMEAALAKSFTTDAIKDLKGNADDLLSDIHSTNEYRAHLVGVLARRAVAEA